MSLSEEQKVCGYLQKVGNNWRSWKTRWFQIHGESQKFLSYYAAPPTNTKDNVNQELGRIPLNGAQITADDVTRPNSFRVRPMAQDRVYIMTCSSAQERTAWMNSLARSGALGWIIKSTDEKTLENDATETMSISSVVPRTQQPRGPAKRSMQKRFSAIHTTSAMATAVALHKQSRSIEAPVFSPYAHAHTASRTSFASPFASPAHMPSSTPSTAHFTSPSSAAYTSPHFTQLQSQAHAQPRATYSSVTLPRNFNLSSSAHAHHLPPYPQQTQTHQHQPLPLSQVQAQARFTPPPLNTATSTTPAPSPLGSPSIAPAASLPNANTAPNLHTNTNASTSAFSPYSEPPVTPSASQPLPPASPSPAPAFTSPSASLPPGSQTPSSKSSPTAVPDVPLLEGYLSKRPPKFFKPWRKRFFQLFASPPRIVYFETEQLARAAATAPLGVLYLHGAALRVEPANHTEFALELAWGQSTVLVQAADKMQRLEWTANIAPLTEVTAHEIRAVLEALQHARYSDDNSGTTAPNAGKDELPPTLPAALHQRCPLIAATLSGKKEDSLRDAGRLWPLLARGGQVERMGWLLKQGKQNSQWKRRFCVLSTGVLVYFNSEQAAREGVRQASAAPPAELVRAVWGDEWVNNGIARRDTHGTWWWPSVAAENWPLGTVTLRDTLVTAQHRAPNSHIPKEHPYALLLTTHKGQGRKYLFCSSSRGDAIEWLAHMALATFAAPLRHAFPRGAWSRRAACQSESSGISVSDHAEHASGAVVSRAIAELAARYGFLVTEMTPHPQPWAFTPPSYTLLRQVSARTLTPTQSLWLSRHANLVQQRALSWLLCVNSGDGFYRADSGHGAYLSFPCAGNAKLPPRRWRDTDENRRRHAENLWSVGTALALRLEHAVRMMHGAYGDIFGQDSSDGGVAGMFAPQLSAEGAMEASTCTITHSSHGAPAENTELSVTLSAPLSTEKELYLLTDSLRELLLDMPVSHTFAAFWALQEHAYSQWVFDNMVKQREYHDLVAAHRSARATPGVATVATLLERRANTAQVLQELKEVSRSCTDSQVPPPPPPEADMDTDINTGTGMVENLSDAADTSVSTISRDALLKPSKPRTLSIRARTEALREAPPLPPQPPSLSQCLSVAPAAVRLGFRHLLFLQHCEDFACLIPGSLQQRLAATRIYHTFLAPGATQPVHVEGATVEAIALRLFAPVQHPNKAALNGGALHVNGTTDAASQGLYLDRSTPPHLLSVLTQVTCRGALPSTLFRAAQQVCHELVAMDVYPAYITQSGTQRQSPVVLTQVQPHLVEAALREHQEDEEQLSLPALLRKQVNLHCQQAAATEAAGQGQGELGLLRGFERRLSAQQIQQVVERLYAVLPDLVSRPAAGPGAQRGRAHSTGVETQRMLHLLADSSAARFATSLEHFPQCLATNDSPSTLPYPPALDIALLMLQHLQRASPSLETVLAPVVDCLTRSRRAVCANVAVLPIAVALMRAFGLALPAQVYCGHFLVNMCMFVVDAWLFEHMSYAAVHNTPLFAYKHISAPPLAEPLPRPPSLVSLAPAIKVGPRWADAQALYDTYLATSAPLSFPLPTELCARLRERLHDEGTRIERQYAAWCDSRREASARSPQADLPPQPPLWMDAVQPNIFREALLLASATLTQLLQENMEERELFPDLVELQAAVFTPPPLSLSGHGAAARAGATEAEAEAEADTEEGECHSDAAQARTGTETGQALLPDQEFPLAEGRFVCDAAVTVALALRTRAPAVSACPSSPQSATAPGLVPGPPGAGSASVVAPASRFPRNAKAAALHAAEIASVPALIDPRPCTQQDAQPYTSPAARAIAANVTATTPAAAPPAQRTAQLFPLLVEALALPQAAAAFRTFLAASTSVHALARRTALARDCAVYSGLLVTQDQRGRGNMPLPPPPPPPTPPAPPAMPPLPPLSSTSTNTHTHAGASTNVGPVAGATMDTDMDGPSPWLLSSPSPSASCSFSMPSSPPRASPPLLPTSPLPPASASAVASIPHLPACPPSPPPTPSPPLPPNHADVDPIPAPLSENPDFPDGVFPPPPPPPPSAPPSPSLAAHNAHAHTHATAVEAVYASSSASALPSSEVHSSIPSSPKHAHAYAHMPPTPSHTHILTTNINTSTTAISTTASISVVVDTDDAKVDTDRPSPRTHTHTHANANISLSLRPPSPSGSPRLRAQHSPAVNITLTPTAASPAASPLSRVAPPSNSCSRSRLPPNSPGTYSTYTYTSTYTSTLSTHSRSRSRSFSRSYSSDVDSAHGHRYGDSDDDSDSELGHRARSPLSYDSDDASDGDSRADYDDQHGNNSGSGGGRSKGRLVDSDDSDGDRVGVCEDSFDTYSPVLRPTTATHITPAHADLDSRASLSSSALSPASTSASASSLDRSHTRGFLSDRVRPSLLLTAAPTDSSLPPPPPTTTSSSSSPSPVLDSLASQYQHGGPTHTDHDLRRASLALDLYLALDTLRRLPAYSALPTAVLSLANRFGLFPYTAYYSHLATSYQYSYTCTAERSTTCAAECRCALDDDADGLDTTFDADTIDGELLSPSLSSPAFISASSISAPPAPSTPPTPTPAIASATTDDTVTFPAPLPTAASPDLLHILPPFILWRLLAHVETVLHQHALSPLPAHTCAVCLSNRACQPAPAQGTYALPPVCAVEGYNMNYHPFAGYNLSLAPSTAYGAHLRVPVLVDRKLLLSAPVSPHSFVFFQSYLAAYLLPFFSDALAAPFGALLRPAIARSRALSHLLKRRHAHALVPSPLTWASAWLRRYSSPEHSPMLSGLVPWPCASLRAAHLRRLSRPSVHMPLLSSCTLAARTLGTFLDKRMCAENIAFAADLEDVLWMPSGPCRALKTRRLLEYYICNEAPQQVNLPSHLRSEVEFAVEGVEDVLDDQALMEEAEEEEAMQLQQSADALPGAKPSTTGAGHSSEYSDGTGYGGSGNGSMSLLDADFFTAPASADTLTTTPTHAPASAPAPMPSLMPLPASPSPQPALALLPRPVTSLSVDVGLCDELQSPRRASPSAQSAQLAPLRSELAQSVAAAVNHVLWQGLGPADPAKHRHAHSAPPRGAALTCDSDYPLVGYWADGALQWLCEAQNEVMGVLVKRDQLPAFLQDKSCQALERVLCELPATPGTDVTGVHSFLLPEAHAAHALARAPSRASVAAAHCGSIAAAMGLAVGSPAGAGTGAGMGREGEDEYRRVWGGVSGSGVGATRPELFGVQHTLATSAFD